MILDKFNYLHIFYSDISDMFMMENWKNLVSQVKKDSVTEEIMQQSWQHIQINDDIENLNLNIEKINTKVDSMVNIDGSSSGEGMEKIIAELNNRINRARNVLL